MSFQNKDFINEILNKFEKQGQEVREVKRLGQHFKETDKARTAKEAFYSDQLKDLRGRFSQFFARTKAVEA